MPTIDALSHRLLDYLDIEKVNQVRRAYYYAEQAHDGQARKSGEAYITHPLAAADILAKMHLDHESLMAAMLHDVIEDTAITYEGVASQFGDTVAMIVDGVSKLTHLEFDTKAEAQAENFQKMVLAMAHDLRVILVKLADRLHNMRTLGAMPPHKQRLKARETLEIYAPIALRLGMKDFEVELEDLAFRAHHPWRLRVLQKRLLEARRKKQKMLSRIESEVKASLASAGLFGDVSIHEKHFFSIYKKMERGVRFRDQQDIFSLRVVTNTVDDCYRILGAVHQLYKPVPNRLKDHIAIPKANAYQSLHTSLFVHRGTTIDFQIRTKEMDAVARHGVAEYSHYKAYGDSASALDSYQRSQRWIAGLLELNQRSGDSMEFIENVKKDLFPSEVFVFTPKGRIHTLPAGATPVDFAYDVHTGLGNECVSCKVDNRLAPLSVPLVNGQMVEIISTKSAQPNAAWLNFVVTPKARMAIRHFLKHQQRHESIELGKRLLNQFLAKFGLSPDNLDEEVVASLLTETQCKTMDALFEEIGLGNRQAFVVARRIKGLEDGAHAKEGPVSIKGAAGLGISYATCCYPVKGDSIVGYLGGEGSKGLVVHRSRCQAPKQSSDEVDRCVYVAWEEEALSEYAVSLTCDVMPMRGTLAALAGALASVDAEASMIDLTDDEGVLAKAHLMLRVTDRDHLITVMKALKGLTCVNRIVRS